MISQFNQKNEIDYNQTYRQSSYSLKSSLEERLSNLILFQGEHV